MLRFISVIGASLWLWAGCVTNKEQVPTVDLTADTAAKASEHHDVWFKGTVEQAFEAARENDRPIFIYWGAVWCPPCNELKSEVFSKVRFAELMVSSRTVHSQRAYPWAAGLSPDAISNRAKR